MREVGDGNEGFVAAVLPVADASQFLVPEPNGLSPEQEAAELAGSGRMTRRD